MIVNIVFESDEDFGEVGEIPILNREQQVKQDIERFEITILRENKEVFMGPVRPPEVGEHRIDLKPGVVRIRNC